MHPLVKKFLTYDSYVKSPIEKSISASKLSTPTQEIILSRLYPENKLDFICNIPSAIGTGFHLYAEKAMPVGFEFDYDGDNYELFGKEVSMNCKVGHGFSVTGTSDLLFKKNKRDVKKRCTSIGDYKTVKTYGIKKNPPHWRIQMSIYNWLASKWFKTRSDKTAVIVYFNKSAEAEGKLKKAMDTMTLDLMSMQETEDFIENKVSELSKYWDITKDDIDKLPRCSDEENWNNRKCSTWCPHIGVCGQINCFANGNYNFSM